MKPGARFQNNFKNSVPKEWLVYRLNDSSGSWSNTGASRFTPRNASDFVVFTGVHLFFVECKSFLGKSMPYNNIGKNQLKDLVKIQSDPPENAFGIFCLNWREHNLTYILDANQIEIHKKTSGRKSIPLEFAERNGVIVKAKLKQVNYAYDVKGALESYSNLQF